MALMPSEGRDHPADAVDQHRPAEQRRGPQRAVPHPPQRQGDEQDDDEGVEDDRRQDGARGRGQAHDVQGGHLRVGAQEQGRQDGEVLGHVVGDGEGGQRAAGHQQLLAHLDHLEQLGGVRVEVDHVAGLLGRLGAGVHGHPHVGLGQRRRVVGAVAGHGHQVALGLLLLDEPHLGLGRRLGQVVVHPGLAGDGGGGARVVAGDHHGADAHGAEALEALLDAALDHVGQADDAEDAVALGHRQRGAALAGDAAGDALDLGGDHAALALDPGRHRVDRALADLPAVEVAAAHAGRGGERRRTAPPARGCPGPAGGTAPWPARRWTGPRASRRPGWPAGRRPPGAPGARPGPG